MDREGLSRMLKESAAAVLSYVEDMQFATDPPMGVSVSEVGSYDVWDGYAVLHLQSLPQDTGSLELMVDDKVYSDEEAGFTRYDEVSRTIMIRPDPSLLSLMSISHPRVRVISDMKFLLRAMTAFLDRYSGLIRLPDVPPCVGEPCFPEGSPPSEEQVSAVRAILSNGMSYVWGAPGTGKTQFVLATCIKTCVRDGLKVAVFAPTNNSVEQVLRGILKAFPESELGGGILRLGVPTREFLMKHPEMCEDRQAQRRADRLECSIRNLEEVIFERTCERVRKDVDAIVERLSRMDPGRPPDPDPELEAMISPILALCSAMSGARDSGSDLRKTLSEARSLLYDRDRPALGIPEYSD
ncbi:MAG: AAA family ATPase, partial [Candidatus Methanomethylophilaceae archaeon]|nr:AAA family ATPase [Candidatus Methanomethylophilaceae archaeon]